jgi:uncharacterized membrane protein
MTRLRNYFLTGLIVCRAAGDDGLHRLVVHRLGRFLGKAVYPGELWSPTPTCRFAVPGFGLIVAVVMITLIGFLTANFVGRAIVGFGERLLNRTCRWCAASTRR